MSKTTWIRPAIIKGKIRNPLRVPSTVSNNRIEIFNALEIWAATIGGKITRNPWECSDGSQLQGVMNFKIWIKKIVKFSEIFLKK